MKIAIIMMALVMLAGCTAPITEKISEKAMETQIEKSTGGDADVDIDGSDMTIKTDEGDVNIETKGLDSGEWCKQGAEWKMTANMQEGMGNAQWIIQGLETTGEYAGLCHVVYTVQGDGQEMKMDYYFNEAGDSGYMEMDVNGKKMKQEWHG